MNEALAQRFGTGATIGVGNMAALANADIDLGVLLEALDTQISGVFKNPAEVSDHGSALDAAIKVLSVITATTSITAGEPPAESGWVGFGEEGLQEQCATARIHADVQVEPYVLGSLDVGVQVASIHLRIDTELAGSAATLGRMASHITSLEGEVAKFLTTRTALHPANGTLLQCCILGFFPIALQLQV